MTESMRERLSGIINGFIEKNSGVDGANIQVEADGTIVIDYWFKEAV